MVRAVLCEQQSGPRALPRLHRAAEAAQVVSTKSQYRLGVSLCELIYIKHIINVFSTRSFHITASYCGESHLSAMNMAPPLIMGDDLSKVFGTAFGMDSPALQCHP